MMIDYIMINNENSTNLSADSLQAPQIQIDWLYIFYSSFLTKYIKVRMQCNNMIQYT